MTATKIEGCPACRATGWIEDSRHIPRRCLACKGQGTREVRYVDDVGYRAENRKMLASLRKLHAAGIWQIDNLPEGVDELPGDFLLSMRPGPVLEVLLQDIMQQRKVSYDDALLIFGEEFMQRRGGK